jgi:hypothetical protein
MGVNPFQPPDTRPPKRVRRFRVFLATLLIIYLTSYVGLSRHGFTKSDAIGLTGLWFFAPEDGTGWRRLHYTCVVLFLPLIAIDNLIGTGRPPVNEPIWDLY